MEAACSCDWSRRPNHQPENAAAAMRMRMRNFFMSLRACVDVHRARARVASRQKVAPAHGHTSGVKAPSDRPHAAHRLKSVPCETRASRIFSSGKNNDHRGRHHHRRGAGVQIHRLHPERIARRRLRGLLHGRLIFRGTAARGRAHIFTASAHGARSARTAIAATHRSHGAEAQRDGDKYPNKIGNGGLHLSP